MSRHGNLPLGPRRVGLQFVAAAASSWNRDCDWRHKLLAQRQSRPMIN